MTANVGTFDRILRAIQGIGLLDLAFLSGLHHSLSHAFKCRPRPSSTRNLIGGAALFGIGWCIAGICPGAAIPALGTGRWGAALLLISVAGGFYIRRLFRAVPERATT